MPSKYTGMTDEERQAIVDWRENQTTAAKQEPAAKERGGPVRAIEVERWGRREHVSVATAYAPDTRRTREDRGQFEATIRHGTDGVPLVDEECRLTISGPTMGGVEQFDVDLDVWGVDLYVIRDLLTAAIQQAEADSGKSKPAARNGRVR